MKRNNTKSPKKVCGLLHWQNKRACIIDAVFLSKSILEGSREAKSKRRRFRRPRGRLKDLLWEAIGQPKVVPKPSWKRSQHATDVEERFGLVLGGLGHQFLIVF